MMGVMSPRADSYEMKDQNDNGEVVTVTKDVIIFWSATFVILAMLITFVLVMHFKFGQKTRTPPPRRMYGGTQARQSLTQVEPTIYVSPNNFPPPPKYECLAPPSYEEVVGVHYPQYQNQPITQPITAAMATAQTSAANVTEPPVVVTVMSETRTTVPVSSS